jgi:hypothetical protein
LCTDEEEYREFLDLPRTIWVRHPLCFSVGHKVHGKSMATGWPHEPRYLSDRKNETNNILVETWTSNVAKFDMSKKDCDDMRDDMVNFKLANPELYNKANTPSAASFPQRNAELKFADLTWDDIQAEGLSEGIEVDLSEDASVDQGGNGDEDMLFG